MKEASKRKKPVPKEQREIILLKEIGTGITMEDFTKKFKCSMATVYRDLETLRKQRDLIHQKRIAHIAEEELNRLSWMVEKSFEDLKNSYDVLDDIKIAKTKGIFADGTYTKIIMSWMDEVRKCQLAFRFNEESLIRFMKTVGIYRVQEERVEDPDKYVMVFNNMGTALPEKVEKEINSKPKAEGGK